MLHVDLTPYSCPQLFIIFKLGLKNAILLQKAITFQLSVGQNTDDIERYLQKMMFSYKFDKQKKLLVVEPKRV